MFSVLCKIKSISQCIKNPSMTCLVLVLETFVCLNLCRYTEPTVGYYFSVEVFVLQVCKCRAEGPPLLRVGGLKWRPSINTDRGVCER